MQQFSALMAHEYSVLCIIPLFPHTPMQRNTLVLLPILAGLMLSGCKNEAAALKEDLAAANRCETADDCELIGSKCPFDCYIYVHKDEADALRTRVDAFQSQCEYSCIAITGVECIEHKCTVKNEMPTEN